MTPVTVHEFLRVMLKSGSDGDVLWGHAFVETEGGSPKWTGCA